MHELRLLFAPAENGSFTVTLEPAGVPVPLSPFLTDDDYKNLHWYLEDYMDLPDGGAVIRTRGDEAASRRHFDFGLNGALRIIPCFGFGSKDALLDIPCPIFGSKDAPLDILAHHF